MCAGKLLGESTRFGSSKEPDKSGYGTSEGVGWWGGEGERESH